MFDSNLDPANERDLGSRILLRAICGLGVCAKRKAPMLSLCSTPPHSSGAMPDGISEYPKGVHLVFDIV